MPSVSSAYSTALPEILPVRNRSTLIIRLDQNTKPQYENLPVSAIQEMNQKSCFLHCSIEPIYSFAYLSEILPFRSLKESGFCHPLPYPTDMSHYF